jgi:hypothetical protein
VNAVQELHAIHVRQQTKCLLMPSNSCLRMPSIRLVLSVHHPGLQPNRDARCSAGRLKAKQCALAFSAMCGSKAHARAARQVHGHKHTHTDHLLVTKTPAIHLLPKTPLSPAPAQALLPPPWPWSPGLGRWAPTRCAPPPPLLRRLPPPSTQTLQAEPQREG